MTTLVVGDDDLLVLADDPAPAFGARDHAIDGLVELVGADRLLVAARGQDRSLVDEVGEVGAGEARRATRDRLDVHRLVERLALDVDVEDLVATLDVGPIEDDLAVEPARAQERRVEDVRTVGGRDHDHVRVGVEAVHLDQDLVEGLLALVVRAAETGAALATDRVDLVDEDDARRVALCLLEQVPHPGCADANEHLHELGARDREERHAGLAGNGAGEQRLAGAGRSDQQHASRNAGAETVELLGILQELDHLGQLLLRLVHSGDVVEGHDRLVAEEHAGPALPEAHRLVIGALRLAHHEEDEPADQEDRQQSGDQEGEDAARGALLGGSQLRAVELPGIAAGAAAEIGEVVGRDLGRDDRLFLLAVRHGGYQAGALFVDGRDLSGMCVGDQLAVLVLGRLTATAHERPQDGQSEDGQDDEHDAVADDAACQRLFYFRLRAIGIRPSADAGPRRHVPSPASIGAANGANKHPALDRTSPSIRGAVTACIRRFE